MSSKSRNSLSIWLSLLVSCLGSTVGSYTVVIPATTFAQPSFKQVPYNLFVFIIYPRILMDAHGYASAHT